MASERKTTVYCGIENCWYNFGGICGSESIALEELHTEKGGCDDGFGFPEEVEDEAD